MPTSNPEEAYLESFLLNADAIRKENSRKYMVIFEDAMQELKYTDKKRFREIRKKYRVAKALYSKYDFLAKETDKKIHLLKENSPELLTQLLNLHRTSSNKLTAYIGSKVRFSSLESLGDTHIRFEIPEQSPLPSLQIESEHGMILLPPQHNAVKITLATDASIEDCRHELGHFAYVIVKPESYYQFLVSNNHTGNSDGHLHGDPSGEWANQFELRK